MNKYIKLTTMSNTPIYISVAVIQYVRQDSLGSIVRIDGESVYPKEDAEEIIKLIEEAKNE